MFTIGKQVHQRDGSLSHLSHSKLGPLANLSLKIYTIGDKTMKDSVMDQIQTRIGKMSHGSVFVPSDFTDIAGYENAKKCLLRLERSGQIRHIIRGVYDKPYFSTLLQEFASPDIENVASAIARNFNWKISPSGITALNLLGLSTQVSNRYEYYSSGQYKTYQVGNITIHFKHRSSKEILSLSYKSALVANALKEMGPDIDSQALERIRNQLSFKEREELLTEARITTKWIFDLIKIICK